MSRHTELTVNSSNISTLTLAQYAHDTAFPTGDSTDKGAKIEYDTSNKLTITSRQAGENEDDTIQHTLMLVVTDDNGEVDSSSLMFGVIDTQSDPEVQNSSIVFLTGILASVFFILIAVYLMLIVRQERVPDVRPWDLESNNNHEDEATSSRTQSDSN